MESTTPPPKRSKPRNLVVTNELLEFGNIEAWLNIIRSYKSLHPTHRVILYYKGEVVNNLINLFKLGRPVAAEGFQLEVAAPDEDFTHEPKLFRLLVEGAGPDYERFIIHELHTVLKLF